MQAKGKEGFKFMGKLGLTGALLLASGFTANYAMATVKGVCSNCHTMHNSQDGATVVSVTGAHWSGSGATAAISGGGSSANQTQLLKTDCVGCHSSTGSDTIVVDGAGNKYPIVYNIGAYPTGKELAGGSFTGVASDETKGHNVLGISSPDTRLSNTPLGAYGAGGGAPGHQSGCANSCHQSLALTDAQAGPYASGGALKPEEHEGCQGCHMRVGHHNTNDTSYRFLGGHLDDTQGSIISGGGVPAGPGLPNPYEAQDGNWEQGGTASAGNHNFYQAETHGGTGSIDGATVGHFCKGCHTDFHAMGVVDPFTGVNKNGGNADGFSNTPLSGATVQGTPNPWLRHPSSVDIPSDGEYGLMMGVVNYNPLIPVARRMGQSSSTIQPGDQVFCLSCHRAHGSDEQDALRFKYSDMIAHTPNVATDGTGCFYCHTTKDDA